MTKESSKKRWYKTGLGLFGVLMTGFAGGWIGPQLLHWTGTVNIKEAADAVAVANTYIVFTTIIFVGATAVLAVAGYMLAQNLEAAKEGQEERLCEAIKRKLESDEVAGTQLAVAMLENPDVIRFLRQQLETKIDDLLKERAATAGSNAAAAQKEVDEIRDLLAKGAKQ